MCLRSVRSEKTDDTRCLDKGQVWKLPISMKKMNSLCLRVVMSFNGI